jgi:hypothetical protein
LALLLHHDLLLLHQNHSLQEETNAMRIRRQREGEEGKRRKRKVRTRRSKEENQKRRGSSKTYSKLVRSYRQ